MALFFKDGLASQSLVGDLMAAGSGITIAWMMLLLRKQRSASPRDSILLGNILAALCGLPFYFRGPAPDLRGWAFLIILGLFQQGASYALYAYAIQRVTALQAVIILTLEPILNPIWVLLVLGERPAGWALAGGALVVGAVTLRAVALAVGQRARRGRVAAAASND